MRSQPVGWISSGVIPRSVALNNQLDVITRTTVEIIVTRRDAVCFIFLSYFRRTIFQAGISFVFKNLLDVKIFCT